MYPGSLPSFAGFTSSHTLSADSHASQHNSEQAEIIALATKMGTGASTPASGLVLRSGSAGVSAWGQVVLTTDVTGVLPVANGGIGQNSLTSLPLASPAISGIVSGGATYSSPTLTTPTIASFASANHDHTNSAGGGQLGTNALQNLAVTQAKRTAITKVGSFTVTGNGAIPITGVGFIPSVVLFMHTESTHVSASVQNFGLGWSNGSTSGVTSLRGQEAGDFSGAVSTSFAGAVGGTGGTQVETLAMTSMDSDGFTVTASNHSGNTLYLYLAIA